jgi:hypothetical protein
MNKWQLIEITLKQLAKQWEHNKDLFECDVLGDPGCSSGALQHYFVRLRPPENPDPEQQQLGLVNKTITITYIKKDKSFQCEIKSKTSLPSSNRSDISITATSIIVPMRSLYWNFRSLRKQIKKWKKDKSNNEYLQDLCKIFPGTLDNQILGDDYE